MSVYIIAEAGDNHNGDINLAYKLVDVAKNAGADCVKFQTFITEEIISVNAQKAEYQKESTGEGETQFQMVKKLELTFEDFLNIKDYCKKVGITFMSTPFDVRSVEFLAGLDMPYMKIPSGEITNLPYLEAIAKSNKNMIMSTGMCTEREIYDAINVIRNYSEKEIVLLHCNTAYPTPFEDVNLRAMNTMKTTFGLSVGYSDHTLGIEVPIAATALGATVIEKHFTLDKNLDGPDHKASLEPEELIEMISSIRKIEKSLGSCEKKPTMSEIINKSSARKSIVARKNIRVGEIFNIHNLATKRPGNGVSPMKWYDILGRKSKRDYNKDEMIIDE